MSDTTERLRKAAMLGMTAAEAARMVGLTAGTVRRKAKKAGFKFPNAHTVFNQAIRDQQIQNEAELEKQYARREFEERIRQIKYEADSVACPAERKEMIYGAALLAFEQKQHSDKLRPKLPCDTSASSYEAKAKRTYATRNWKPLDIKGVTFPSRTSAAMRLGVSRGELSAMISKDATPHRRRKLAYLLEEYCRKSA